MVVVIGVPNRPSAAARADEPLSRLGRWGMGGAPIDGAPSPATQVDVVIGHRGPPAEARKATAPTPVRPGAQISRTGPAGALTGSFATTRGTAPRPAQAPSGGVPAAGSARRPDGNAPVARCLGSLPRVSVLELTSARVVGVVVTVSDDGSGCWCAAVSGERSRARPIDGARGIGAGGGPGPGTGARARTGAAQGARTAGMGGGGAGE